MDDSTAHYWVAAVLAAAGGGIALFSWPLAVFVWIAALIVLVLGVRLARKERGVADATPDAEGWRGVDLEGRFFAWEGPTLHGLQDWPPVPTPPGLTDALREAGMEPRYGLESKLRKDLAAGFVQIFETDRKTWRKEVLGGGRAEDQVLEARHMSKRAASPQRPPQRTDEQVRKQLRRQQSWVWRWRG